MTFQLCHRQEVVAQEFDESDLCVKRHRLEELSLRVLVELVKVASNEDCGNRGPYAKSDRVLLVLFQFSILLNEAVPTRRTA
jgi:hypothetical protein